ncbi:MAG: outer membrane protein assembly factor BamA [Salinisphaeraceae bacterium]|nr:outer membrane protein assembly factor BamA [Salinisphaeraceae bacterium]
MPLTTIRLPLAGLLLLATSICSAFDAFEVERIQIDGLQRLEEGTVLTYLPFSVGDRMGEAAAQRSISALYDTGLFEDVSLGREGNTLIIRIEERPEISSFTIEGNDAIGGEQLMESLAEQGLAEGELFRRALLDQVSQEMRRQYYANGFYGVSIDTKVNELPQNRVEIDIQVEEGQVATIRDINIVGNEAFEDDELLKIFQLESTKSFFQAPIDSFRSKDRYSKEKLLGDLESLNSFYENRGYLRFSVSSVQVALSPDKRDIYLTVNILEGDQYTIKDYRFAGDLIVPEASLQRLVAVRKGDIFSRQLVTTTSNLISSGLSDFGYAFAEVDPLTKLDDEEKTVELTFFVEPGDRAYVRRISFAGNSKTDDQTLRREMRQFEGAAFSRRGVERSRTRLLRLPFIEDAQVETEPVPGSDDLVDVKFDVRERAAGTIQAGVGFSDAQGFLINGSVTHSNFRGTGHRLSLRAETNDFAQVVSASWTDPYFTEDGISRTLSAFYRNTDQVIRFGSGFDLNTIGGSMTFGIPISEYSSIRLGVGLEKTEITTLLIPGLVTSQLAEFVLENGRDFTQYEIRTGWVRDTRNRTFFPTRGTSTAVNFDVKVPGSDLEYYIATFTHERYFPFGRWLGKYLSDKVVLGSEIRVADAVQYGAGEDVPPYDNFFAGGARTVRGFEDGSLGPRDDFDNPFGGQFITTMQNELVIPTFLESDGKSTRLSLFYDIGNVFRGADEFETSELRKSAGVALDWFTPFFGLLRVSYAAYVDAQDGDDEDRFQFSFGVGL